MIAACVARVQIAADLSQARDCQSLGQPELIQFGDHYLAIGCSERVYRDDPQKAVGPDGIWAMDFLHDQPAPGTKLRILTIVDIHSRFCPAADPRFTYRGEDVVQTLERVRAPVGYPRTIRVDKGSEFISRDLDL